MDWKLFAPVRIRCPAGASPILAEPAQGEQAIRTLVASHADRPLVPVSAWVKLPRPVAGEPLARQGTIPLAAGADHSLLYIHQYSTMALDFVFHGFPSLGRVRPRSRPGAFS
jgi:hypothetical protein